MFFVIPSEFQKMNTANTAEVTSHPVTGQERIVSLDVLRGFAVLGILVMNIQSFAMVSTAYSNPYSCGAMPGEGGFTGISYAIWYASHLLADLKFMALFSMLFGAGIIVMTTRREQRGLKTTGFHYRRISWLLIIGLVHAYCIWFGDILVVYAMTASVVFWAKGLRPGWLITLGLFMLFVAFALSVGSGLSMPYWPDEQIVEFNSKWAPTAEAAAEELALCRGNWMEQMTHRAPLAFMFHTFLFGFFFFWRAGGLMLLGMALFKMRIFDASRSRKFYRLMMLAGLGIGLPIVAYGVYQNNQHSWNMNYSFFFGPQFNYWGSLLVALGYVGAIMLLCKSDKMSGLKRRLARVGQMAMTNYLSHSLICTLIFYGHGLGRIGTFSRLQQISLVAAIFIFQLFFSDAWLSRFRFGPMEWLWRSLTYWRLQPVRLPT